MILWFTGQPGSGKTSIAKMIHHKDTFDGTTIVVDGDELRKLYDNKDYTREGRTNNMEDVHKLVKFLNHKGFIVLVSLVSPYRDIRERFKTEMGKRLVEFFVHTDEKRGREHFFVDDYEPPLENFIDLDTTNTSVDETVSFLLGELYAKI